MDKNEINFLINENIENARKDIPYLEGMVYQQKLFKIIYERLYKQSTTPKPIWNDELGGIRK